MSYLSDLPLPDLQVRDGDADPVDFTLRNASGAPINLTGRVVELRLLPLRGAQTAIVYRSDDALPAIAINSPTGGAIQFTNPTTPTSGLVISAERYTGYFAIYEAATPTTRPRTVPQARPLWIEMLPRFA